MDLIWFLVIVVLIAILVSIIWQIFGVSALFATMSPTQRLLVALLGLLIIIIIVLYFFSNNIIRLPGGSPLGVLPSLFAFWTVWLVSH